MSAIQRDVVKLIQQQRWGALATVSDDQPLASMVAYSVEPGLDGLLFFLSQLSAHTRHLLAHPQTSIAITSPDLGEGDPQLLPRVSLQGRAVPLERGSERFAQLGATYVRRFPDSLPRFELGDFHLFHFAIDEARYVGGFACASTFTGAQLRETASETA